MCVGNVRFSLTLLVSECWNWGGNCRVKNKVQRGSGGRQIAYLVCSLKIEQRVTSFDILKNGQFLQFAIPCPFFHPLRNCGEKLLRLPFTVLIYNFKTVYYFNMFYLNFNCINITACLTCPC